MTEDRTPQALLHSWRDSKLRSPRCSQRTKRVLPSPHITRMCAWSTRWKAMTMRANDRVPEASAQADSSASGGVVAQAGGLAKTAFVCENGTGRWRAFTAMAEPCRKTVVVVKGLQPKTKTAVESHLKTKEHAFQETGVCPRGHG